MNGPATMYRTAQVIRHDLPVELPDCMYKVRNVHGQSRVADLADRSHVGADITEQVKRFLQGQVESKVMAELAERQEIILQQLEDLRLQMLKLKDQILADCNNKEDIKESRQSKPAVLQTKQLADIVVKASPSFPPYSLLLLQRLWRNSLRVSVRTHLHSSVASLEEKSAAFSRLIKDEPPANGGPKLQIVLIWKDIGPNTEFVVSHTSIVGEVNLLRHLARLAPQALKYESLENVMYLDALLDTCYCLPRARTKTERARFVQALSKSLGKGEWMCGSSELTVADVAAYSALRQVGDKECSQALNKWLQKCEQVC